MRILLITGSFPPMRCGVGDYTNQLARALAGDPKLQVAVVTSKAARPSRSPTDFALFPVVEAWDWYELRAVMDVIRRWMPDVVHIQYPTRGYGEGSLPSLLPVYLCVAKIPVVQTWHELYLFKFPSRSRGIFRFVSKAVVPGGLVVVREGYRRNTQVLLRWAFLNKTVRFIPNASAIPAVELTVAERQSLRAQYARASAHMIVHFGFVYPSKRVELLFQIADPNDSHVVIIGDSLREEDLRNLPASVRPTRAIYYRSLRQLADSEVWKGKVTIAGFLPDHDAARLIAAADAVVLPIRGGSGGWNTSVHAGQAQGTFVLTTSTMRRGYDTEDNTYYAEENDVEEMREALRRYSGRRTNDRKNTAQGWQSIRDSHIELYGTQILSKTGARRQRKDK